MIHLLRALVAVVLLALGAVSGLAAVLVHGDWWGLVLAWAAMAAVLVALPREWYGRSAFAAGWILLMVNSLGTRPEGDFLVASTTRGYLLLLTAPVLVVVCVVGLLGGRGAPRRVVNPRGLDVPS